MVDRNQGKQAQDKIRAAIEDALASGEKQLRKALEPRLRELVKDSANMAKAGLEATEAQLRKQIEALEQRIELLEKAAAKCRASSARREVRKAPSHSHARTYSRASMGIMR